LPCALCHGGGCHGGGSIVSLSAICQGDFSLSASSRNSGRKRRQSVRVPWRDAVQLFGDETSLVKYLTRPAIVHDLGDKDRASTRSKYRDQGVPIQEIGERILERLGSGFRLPQDDKDLADVIAQVRALHEMRKQHQHREHDWRVLLALLNLPVRYSGNGVRPGRP
jgi:hypothetical protein